MKLSSSQRQFLLQATQEYAANLHLAEEYLQTRGLSVEEGKQFHLGVVATPLPSHEGYANRLAIPYITPSGVVDIRFRSILHQEPKYMSIPGAKTTMFNAQAVLTSGSFICVTEGEIDCVTTVVKTGYPAVGIPGANNWKPYYTKILDDFEIVIVLADGDNPGLEFGKKVSRELSNVSIVQMPEGHDVNSVVIKEGSEWLSDRIKRCISR